MNYGDVIYDQPDNSSLIKYIQYKAALAITGAIKGSSRQKLYQELGLKRLKTVIWNVLGTGNFVHYAILGIKSSLYM